MPPWPSTQRPRRGRQFRQSPPPDGSQETWACYYRKYRPQEFSIVKHVVLPFFGMVAIAVPIYYLFKPPQPQPYNWFPWVGLGLVVVFILYSIWLVRRDPGLGDRVGSIIADE